MDTASTLVEVLKIFGSSVRKNIKLRMKSAAEFFNEKEKLQSRLRDIEETLQSQLGEGGVGKVTKQEVADWMKEVKRATETYDYDYFLTKKDGCFCYTSPTAKHIDERTKELKMLFDEGGVYTIAGVNLVQDDYLIIVNHLMSEFQKTAGMLGRRNEEINSALREQLRSGGKTAKDEVKCWMDEVDKILQTSRDEVSSSSGVLPLTSVAKLLQEKNGELMKLFDQGGKYTDSGAVLVEVDPSFTRGLDFLYVKYYGMDKALEEILKYLRGDKVTRIAVWGARGVGKTTFMMQVHNTFLRESTFDQVIWVTVSPSNLTNRTHTTISRIQHEIAMQLTNRPLEEEEDSTRRAAMVRRMLQQGSYLLILDDVWEAFADEEVGIPSMNSCLKLVLTTRLRSVARQMGCGEIIKLRPLYKEEALQLFLDTVGKAVLSDGGTIKPDLEPTLLQIVSECHGLPLAIVTIAASLKGDSDHSSWRNAVQHLRRDARKEDQMGVILKSRYDTLENVKLQHCFLYCALYPRGFEIPVQELIEYWIEEGYIDQMETRYEMICEGHAILRQLQDRDLLQCIESEVDETADEIHRILGLDFGGNYESVKMDDQLRDMALEIMSESPRVFVRAGLTELDIQEEEAWEDDAEKVSLMQNGMEEIPLPKTHPKIYNMLTTLLMPNNNIFSIPESFFMQMPGLKILDLSWNRTLRSLPDSISSLENLTTLLLRACESLRKVPSLIKCLRLTKLDLSWAGIEQVPDGMEMLVNLRYLDLRAPRIGKLPQGLLPRLLNLQYLFAIEMEAEEVVTLSKLEYLQGTVGGGLDGMRILLRFMQNQEKQIASRSFEVEEPSLALFLDTDMEGNLVLFLNDKFILGDFYTTVGGDDDRDLGCVNRILLDNALSLRVLSMQALEKIESVVCSAFNPLQTLTLMRLVELDNLSSVFDETTVPGVWASAPAASNSFFPLNSIIIKECPALKNLFPSAHLLGYLQNLQHIEVMDCKEMEEIVAASTSEGGGQEKLALPQLKTLKLNDLPALKSICSTENVLICDSLETLEITDCEELKRIPLYLPQLDDAAAPLALKTITVDSEEWWKASEWCHPNATDILLPKCVFSSDGYDEVLEELTLPKLKTLELKGLTAWKGIRSSSKVLSSTGSLEITEIRDCPKLMRKSSLVSSPTSR